MKYKSLIGQKYVPFDNSYSINLTCPDEKYYLAGTSKSNPIECEIVSEPYKYAVRTRGLEDRTTQEMLFINVEYKGDIVRVLYNEKQVNIDLQSEIDRNKHLDTFFLIDSKW